jgi:hypothetical protein
LVYYWAIWYIKWLFGMFSPAWYVAPTPNLKLLHMYRFLNTFLRHVDKFI